MVCRATRSALILAVLASGCAKRERKPSVESRQSDPIAAASRTFGTYDEAMAYARGGECESASMSRSTWIRGAEFCHRGTLGTGSLLVNLKGRWYIHEDVPNDVWREFRDAESPGGYHNRSSRRKYRLTLH